MTDGLAHPLHLALAALVERQLERRARGAGTRPAENPHARRRGDDAVVERHARAQPLQVAGVGNPLDLRLVDLLDPVAGMGETVRELAVVRQEQHTGRVRVEPADRNDAVAVPDEADDRRSPLRVTGRRDDARGLVEQDPDERLRGETLPVELDAVGLRDPGSEPCDPAADRHSPGADQLVGRPSRANARPCQVGIQTHIRHYRRVPVYVSLMKWTSTGLGGLPAWRDRLDEGEHAIEERGGKLLGVYVTLGRYDVVEIFEAPDDETAAQILVAVTRDGNVTTETLRAFTREEAEEIVRGL